MKRFRALCCFIFSLCLLFYAIPRLPIRGFSDLETGFSLIWVSFALFVMSSNLMYVSRKKQHTKNSSNSRSVKQVQQRELSAVEKRGRVSIDL